jgi:hypothetical protein
MDQKLRGLCGQQVPGDTHRNLQVNAHYSAQTFKHILTPVWMLTFTYGAKSYPVVVNGVTGRVAGRHPLSWIKILLLILLLLAAVGGVIYFGQ